MFIKKTEVYIDSRLLCIYKAPFEHWNKLTVIIRCEKCLKNRIDLLKLKHYGYVNTHPRGTADSNLSWMIESKDFESQGE